ncbi:hypothetical protein BN173_170015 [Clostridioides difficile T11]|nr:hypothetical protein BN173_170015 [Clostridioides difficile T11]
MIGIINSGGVTLPETKSIFFDNMKLGV